jgi:hypothetical protein
MSTRCREDIAYIQNVQYWGKDGTAAATPLGIENSPSTEILNFLLAIKQAISLMTQKIIMLTIYLYARKPYRVKQGHAEI